MESESDSYENEDKGSQSQGGQVVALVDSCRRFHEIRQSFELHEAGHPEVKWTDEELLENFEVYFDASVSQFQDMRDPGDHVYTYMNLFGLRPMGGDLFDVGEANVNNEFKRLMVENLAFYSALHRRGLLTADDQKGIQLSERCTAMFKSIVLMQQVISSFLSLHQNSRGQLQMDTDPLGVVSFLCLPSLDDGDDRNRLVSYVLMCLRMANNRRHNGCVYQEKKIRQEDGSFRKTYSWECFCTIEEYPNQVIQRQIHGDIWQLLLSPALKNATIDYLKSCNDVDFPELRPDRHLFSFRNGLYMTSENRFYKFGRDILQPSFVASKYFDQDFDYDEYMSYSHVLDIPTPAFQSILDYQDLEDDVCSIVYMMIGRLLYAINEKDRWQVLFFLKGVANTGKSTIANLVQSFFNPSDVGIMTNKMQSEFPLESLYDKLICICTEIKKSFSMDQGCFQSMISGEKVSVAIKFKTAKSLTWTVPMLFCGNEMGPWKDVGDAIARRLIVVHFLNKVSVNHQKDNLDALLSEEFPAFLFKCNLAYLSYLDTYPDQSLRSNLPDYFRKTSESVQRETNTMESYLHDNRGSFRFGPEFSTPLRNFENSYERYCRRVRRESSPVNMDYCRITFVKYGISLEETEQGPMLVGLARVQEED